MPVVVTENNLIDFFDVTLLRKGGSRLRITHSHSLESNLGTRDFFAMKLLCRTYFLDWVQPGSTAGSMGYDRFTASTKESNSFGGLRQYRIYSEIMGESVSGWD